MFIEMAVRHIDDLRSHLESSAAVLGPHTYEVARRVERRLAWALNRLMAVPAEAGLRTDVIELMKPTSSYVFDLLQNGDWYAGEIASARKAVSATGHVRTSADRGRLAGRMEAQMQLLRALKEANPEQVVRGIGWDVDGNLSVPYFMIDYLLLESEEGAARQLNESAS
jgi:hypothetical protein